MDLVTSSSSGERTLAHFVHGLAARTPGVPLLALRVPAVERTAWRDGRRAAQRVARRAALAFGAACERILRREDLRVHAAAHDCFLVALANPRRASDAPLPADARLVLARLVVAIETALGTAIASGWTHVDDPRETLATAIERAFVWGARERERYEFFSTVAHDLRTPLTAIRGYLETVLDDEIDPPTQRRFLTVARDETLRLARLLDGMFEVSMLDLNAAGSIGGNADLAGSVAVAVALATPLARERNVALVDRTRSVAVRFDPDRLVQIVLNLLENAIAHGREGGRIELTCEIDGRRADLLVDDDGPGIAPEERERVFALAERGANAAPRGTGLGLAVVRLLVERAEGRVRAESAPLGGARLRVTFRRE